jgi:hypothetical protein
MMYIQVFSQDVSFHGDGVATSAKFNLIGWPFNLDFSECGKLEASAEGLITAGPPEELMPLECELDGTFVTVRFPEPVQDRESMVVRLRLKMFV